MKVIIAVSIISLILLVSGCAMNEGIIQTDEFAYLKLIGNLENVTLQINEDPIVTVDPEREDVVYQVIPGTHLVTIYKENKVIIQRKMYFDNKITKEINVK